MRDDGAMTPLGFAPAPPTLALAAGRIVLDEALALVDDPAVASGGFTSDELVVVPVTSLPTTLPAGTAWRLTGHREMARHGASALDTAITVHLLLPAETAGSQDESSDDLLNAAMMRLALALASGA